MNVLNFPFYSGLSGLQLKIPKYRFPEAFQQSSRLMYYASLFNSIEINSSFYKIPQKVTVAKWAGSVSPGFRFTFKLFREITHNKEMHFDKASLSRFLDAIDAAGEHRGCLLIQYPPGMERAYIGKLASLLEMIRSAEIRHWNIAVELRNKSWHHEQTYRLLQAFGAALVIHDFPKSATPLLQQVTGCIYVRFHGPTGNYRGSYTEDFLWEYAGYVKEWLDEGKEVFMYFNNTMGAAFENLQMINAFVAERMDNSGARSATANE